MKYLNIFFFYSIIGYILESLFIKGYVSGILYLPWTPIYGKGVLIALYVYKIIKDRYPKWLEIMLHFIICLIVLSIIEFFAGHLIEFLFKKVYWNYDYLKYNLGKYISLESALIWGIGSTITIYLLNPILEKLYMKIPRWLFILLLIVFIIDVLITFIIKVF